MNKHSIRICLFASHVLLLLSLAACRTAFLPVQQQHQQYQIDSNILPDTAFVNYYLPYKQQLEAEMNRVIGQSAVSLTKPGDVPETLLGNFFADALLAEGRKLYPDADFSFGTKGGLRIELQQGDITVGDIFELMPFENELVILELPASNVERLAQFVADTHGQPVSGLSLTIRNGKAEDIHIGGKPLDLNRTYHLLTYDYLANGGDNMRGLDNPLNRVDFKKKVRESLIDHITELTREGKKINTQLDGRITSN